MASSVMINSIISNLVLKCLEQGCINHSSQVDHLAWWHLSQSTAWDFLRVTPSHVPEFWGGSQIFLCTRAAEGSVMVRFNTMFRNLLGDKGEGKGEVKPIKGHDGPGGGGGQRNKSESRINSTLTCAQSLSLCSRSCYTELFISPSGISELDCATTKTDTAERSISIGRESPQGFFVLGALAYFQVPPLGG